MWARHSEVFLAIWLALSWMIFHYSGHSALIINDYLCFLLISFFALGSYMHKFSQLSLMNFIMGLWLIAFALTPFVTFAASQNYLVVGLLLLMISLVPSHTKRPPVSWIEYLKKRKKNRNPKRKNQKTS